VIRANLAPAVAGASLVLDHVLERGLDPLPRSAEVLACRHQCPGGGERPVVAERLELAHGLLAEVDRLLRG
jgi:hypothetical protein